MARNKAQSAIEYLIVIGFVTLAVSIVLVAAYFYIGMSRDRIRQNQMEALATKIINSAESVFYSGEPSQVTIIVYAPSGINEIEFLNYDLIITASTSSGTMKRAFTSRVILTGNINPGEGTKRLRIKAESDKVVIEQVT